MRYHFPVLFPSAIAPHFFVGELFGCRKPLAFRSQLNDAQDARSDNADAHSLLVDNRQGLPFIPPIRKMKTADNKKAVSGRGRMSATGAG
jgi:hypothetical protein